VKQKIAVTVSLNNCSVTIASKPPVVNSGNLIRNSVHGIAHHVIKRPINQIGGSADGSAVRFGVATNARVLSPVVMVASSNAGFTRDLVGIPGGISAAAGKDRPSVPLLKLARSSVVAANDERTRYIAE